MLREHLQLRSVGPAEQTSAMEEEGGEYGRACALGRCQGKQGGLGSEALTV